MNVKRKIEILLLVLGGCMLAAALGLLFYFHWQDRRAGAAADELTGQVEAVLQAEERIAPEDGRQVASDETEKVPVTEDSSEEKQETDDEALHQALVALPEGVMGLIEFPEYERVLPVMGVYDEELLRQYPCVYGADECQEGQMIIAGHNYQSHFRCIRDFSPENEVIFTALDGEKTVYEVVKREEISGNDRKALLAGGWDLTLFTCAINRQNRVVIRCRVK